MKPQPVPPRPGQESVWDYPRPPRVEQTVKRVQVVFNGVMIADTQRAFRVLETSHPPVYYIPPEDIRMDCLHASSSRSLCEWKGQARYFTVEAEGRRTADAAWCYPNPTEEFAAIRNYVAFYTGEMDACYVDGERVTPQPGGFYGGWITADIAGPFKGVPGSQGW